MADTTSSTRHLGGQTGAGNQGASLTDKAKDVASSAAQTARDVAHTAGQKAESAVEKVGSGMESLAGTIREHAPDSGMLGTASEKVARGLERGGRYLQEEGLSGMGEDLTNLIRRNPIPALLIGLGLGFLLGRALRS
jgi:ElaB/YqjD/DUF883 family membrane-anchored ribosome-binding protein